MNTPKQVSEKTKKQKGKNLPQHSLTVKLLGNLLVESEKQCIVVFGLAEHLKKLLQDSVSGPFVVLFDESLNTKMQEKQMDAHNKIFQQ